MYEEYEKLSQKHRDLQQQAEALEEGLEEARAQLGESKAFATELQVKNTGLQEAQKVSFPPYTC